MTTERVVGPPGCGKTTWLSRQVRRAWEADNRVMVCSLTRTAAAEVAGRDLPIDKQAIGTLHAHAYHSLQAGRLEIADDAGHLAEWNQAHPDLQLSGGRSLDEDNSSISGQPTEADALYLGYHNARAKMLLRNEWPGGVQRFAQVWDAWKREQGFWDFSDLLEVALSQVDEAPGHPDVIFADEAQDFSKLEMSLLEKWGQAAGRLIIVGDPWQSLYEWRGADSRLIFPDREIDMVLAQSYRVPQAVHAAAVKWISAMPGWSPIEYLPTAAPGCVQPVTATWEQPELAADIIERTITDGASVMYLAATARMLQPMLSVLRQRGVPFGNRFRTREGAWNPLRPRQNAVTAAQRLAAFLRLGYEGEWTKHDVLTWGKAVKATVTLPSGSWKKTEAALNNLPDRAVIEQGLWDALVGPEAIEASMTADCQWWLDHLLASRRPTADYPAAIAKHRGYQALIDDPLVTVGTVHSVKGGEADVVLVCPDVSVPGALEWAASDDGKAAIYRLFYVAMTRAKESLYILRPTHLGRSVRLI